MQRPGGFNFGRRAGPAPSDGFIFHVGDWPNDGDDAADAADGRLPGAGAERIGGSEQRQQLNLSSCGLTAFDFKTILVEMSSSSPRKKGGTPGQQLQCLDDSDGLSEAGKKCLAKLASSPDDKAYTSLNVAGNKTIGDDGMEYLHLLPSTVTGLDLSGCGLTNAGIRLVCKFMKRENNSITRLNLQDNTLDDQAAGHVADLLACSESTTLQVLHLQGGSSFSSSSYVLNVNRNFDDAVTTRSPVPSAISPEGFAQLADGIRRSNMSSIKELHIFSGNETVEHVKPVIDALADNSDHSVEILDLSPLLRRHGQEYMRSEILPILVEMLESTTNTSLKSIGDCFEHWLKESFTRCCRFLPPGPRSLPAALYYWLSLNRLNLPYDNTSSAAEHEKLALIVASVQAQRLHSIFHLVRNTPDVCNRF